MEQQKQQRVAELCAWCNEPGFRTKGKQTLCAKHVRFQQMRSQARSDGKSIPCYLELEGLFAAILDMKCPICARVMNWSMRDGSATVISLQHDRDNEAVRLICLGCNVKHSAHPGDSFYKMPGGHKRCPQCETIKPLSEYRVDRSKRSGVKVQCKSCCSILEQRWRENNRAHYNKYQRDRRANL